MHAMNTNRRRFGRSYTCAPTTFWAVLAILFQQERIRYHVGFGRSMSMSTAPPPNRRDFVGQGGTALALFHLSTTFPALAVNDVRINENDSTTRLLNAKTIYWDGPSWSSCRYGTSTLLSSDNNKYNVPPPGAPAIYPKWMEGYYIINYKFTGASFPQGRGILSLRTAGAGLGSCLSLPNVGYNPTAAHAVHFIKYDKNDGSVYEDLAYNVPRRFESFWPQSKVLSVQTNGSADANESGSNRMLSPKCLVTGDGCSYAVNPNLHSPASRVALEFDGPTRRGGRLVQSSDVTMLGHSSLVNDDNDIFCMCKSYSQYNMNQDLQTYYKEIYSIRRTNNNGEFVGKVRVAAFLPYYIKEMDANSRIGAEHKYNEGEAVAMYDYNIFMNSIDATEAASL